MTQIDNITDQANQTTQVVLEDGSILTLQFIYDGSTERWTVNVSHTLLTVNGMNVSCYPNMLRAWRNLIPFGLACTTLSGYDPTNVQDFINGQAQLYVLNEADVQDVEETVFGGVLQ